MGPSCKVQGRHFASTRWAGGEPSDESRRPARWTVSGDDGLYMHGPRTGESRVLARVRRFANPNADANAMFARYEEKFRRWNIEEENDPDAIERRAQAAEAKRKEDMMKGM